MEKPPETTPETLDPLMEATPEDASQPPRTKKQKLILTPEMKADPLSKKLILFSMLFASLAMICIGFLTYIYFQKKNAGHPVQEEPETVKTVEVISQAIEQIHTRLKNDQDLRIEIVAECSNRKACDYIKEHQPEVRDLLVPVVASIDSDFFSSLENKKLVRKKLTDRLNTIEMDGKIIQVHINNLSVEGKPK